MARLWSQIKSSLSGRRRRGGEPLFTLVLATVGIVGVILLSGMAAQAVKQISSQRAGAILTSLQDNISISDVGKVVGKKNLARLMQSYATALAGATIEFEELPDYDIALFFTIAKAIPAQVEVEAFHFEGSAVTVDCIAPDPESIEEMLSAFHQSEYFSNVYHSTPEREGDSYLFQFYLRV